RDGHVTGVQTCALPIFDPVPPEPHPGSVRHVITVCEATAARVPLADDPRIILADDAGSRLRLLLSHAEERTIPVACPALLGERRSEERRVGKEGGAGRW